MQSILDGVTLGATQRVEGDDPAIVEGDHDIEKEVHVTTGQVLVENAFHQLGCSPKRRSRTRCSIALVGAKKKIDLRTLMGEHASSEEGQILWRNHQNFMVLQDALYLHSMPKGENENLLLFVVPKVHWTAILNGCI